MLISGGGGCRDGAIVGGTESPGGTSVPNEGMVSIGACVVGAAGIVNVSLGYGTSLLPAFSPSSAEATTLCMMDFVPLITTLLASAAEYVVLLVTRKNAKANVMMNICPLSFNWVLDSAFYAP